MREDSRMLSSTSQNDVFSVLPQIRESKTVLDSGFHAVDSRFQQLDSGFFVSGTWISDSNRKCDPDFKTQDFEFHKNNFQDSGSRRRPIGS